MRKCSFFLFSFFIIFFSSLVYGEEHIILFGPPGSGKGTFSQNAVKKGNFLHICPGDIVRKEIANQTPFGLEVKERVSLGEDLPEEIIFKIVDAKLEECLAMHKYFILDGFPRSLAAYFFLKNFLLSHNLNRCVVVVCLDAPDEILKERIKDRIVCPNCFHVYNNIFAPPKNEGFCDECCRPLEKRLNDSADVICKRLKNYREKIFPIVKKASQDYFSITLSSREEIDRFLCQGI